MLAPSRATARRYRRIDGCLLFAAFGTAAALLGGFFGAALPLLDSFGHFRAHLALVLLVLALALTLQRFFAAGFAAFLTASLGLHSVIPFVMPQTTAAGTLPPSMPSYSLLQMNLRFDADDMAPAIRRILDLNPDVVTLEEITWGWQSALETIADRYPYQSFCSPNGEKGDVAILSRRPFIEGERRVCEPEAGFAALGVDFDGHAVTIGAQHLRWPYPGRQWRQIERIEPVLGRLKTPLVIGGDFNAAPWTAAVGRYASAGNLRVVAGIGPTFAPPILPETLRRYAGLPIDNVLVSSEVLVLSVTRPAGISSDHLPVLVTFAIPFPRPAEPQVQSVERR